jgi:tetratricopeptide (TPR) repeat protein
MRAIVRYSILVAGGAMLSGCQSFPLTSWLFKAHRPAQVHSERLAGNTAGSLEEGRAFLRDGRISEAVASFQIASMDPAFKADANNGLGVAYARLGRDDLAEKYFRAAMSVEPDNSKFVANLLRLQQQEIVLARVSPPAEALAVAAPAAPIARGPGREAKTLAVATIDRVSRGEVRVRVRQDLGIAPAMVVAFKDTPALPAADAESQTEPATETQVSSPEVALP